jgi:hypothetical protein
MAVTYFGYNVAGSVSKTTGNTSIEALRFQNTAGAGNITEIGVYIKDFDTGGKIRLGIYADTGSTTQPGGRLLDAGETSAVASGDVGTWKTISGLSLAVTANTYYWLCAESDFTAYCGGEDTGGVHSWANVSYEPYPTPFPTIANSDANQLSIRAGVTAGETPSPTNVAGSVM